MPAQANFLVAIPLADWVECVQQDNNTGGWRPCQWHIGQEPRINSWSGHEEIKPIGCAKYQNTRRVKGWGCVRRGGGGETSRTMAMAIAKKRQKKRRNRTADDDVP